MAALEGLPVDVLDTICSALTGYDLFRLSHVNSWAFYYFSQAKIWQKRLGSPVSVDIHPKKAYLQTYSLGFQGVFVDRQNRRNRGACAVVKARNSRQSFTSMFAHNRHHPFGFDLWFSLQDHELVHAGGIILGAQSVAYEEDYWANEHQQFVVVDSHRNLYCSLLSEKPVIATNLMPHRWYHLTLTYNKNHEQRVYLDGELMQSHMGNLHHEWLWLMHAQIGTGCITAGNDFFPEPGDCGWYGFHGIVDEFRVWNGQLSDQDIRALFQGKCDAITMAPWYSMKRDMELFRPINTMQIRCTRPAERTCQVAR